MKRITKYDIDFGCYVIDKEKFNEWEGSDLIDYIGELEDRIEKIQEIIKRALRSCENDINK
jgi:hypothetical protein